MNVNLLYSDKDWVKTQSYYDWDSIYKDLGLRTIVDMSMSDLVMKGTRIMYITRPDAHLGDVMGKVMRVPLKTKEEILYRQEILKDCINNREVIEELYQLVATVLYDWDQLGRKKTNSGTKDSRAGLVTDISVLSLLLPSMGAVRSLLKSKLDKLVSAGFQNLYNRMEEEFSPELERSIEILLNNISFYIDSMPHEKEKNKYTVNVPKISFECGIYDGLKFGDLKLAELETKISSIDPNGIIGKLQGSFGKLSNNSISLYNNPPIQENIANLEFEVVSYVMSYCSEVLYSLGFFFDQLYFQIGFYRAAVNITRQLYRLNTDYCFPVVKDGDALNYDDLKEIVMLAEQKKDAVGNTGNIDGKILTVITGANQGGKSTFLRSVGIAQVMMQCGLVVGAKQYSSSIYPNFFTHFTRREDSAMNSGRLDEELKRMDRIVSHVGENSLILLNESFATTTEIEGSNIAYGIIKALKEEHVRIMTVTHLLSFAQRMYDEVKDDKDSEVAFLSAEHLEDGTRTFKMIPHAPELTSFGLELYEQVLNND
ncbi:MAG: hypothetical protein MJ104_01080 [Lachnospiraceae bacterium]|nr:hypothetical protein [Lachnospiraceae bacterium]